MATKVKFEVKDKKPSNYVIMAVLFGVLAWLLFFRQ